MKFSFKVDVLERLKREEAVSESLKVDRRNASNKLLRAQVQIERLLDDIMARKENVADK